MAYQIIKGSPKEFRVPEYPTFNEERAFHRLLVRADERIVGQEQKERICRKWGWDPEETIREDVIGYEDYHLELARTIFKNGEELSPDDAGKVRPGLIQEARMDFIEGCQGRNDGQGDTFNEALQRITKSLLAQDEKTEATTQSD